MKKETDPASETFFSYLEFRTIDEVHRSSDSECYLWIYKRENYVLFNFVTHYLWASLLSSGQSSWLQIQRFGFDFRRYQIFWKVEGLERGPLSLVSTIQDYFKWKIAAPV
jgi:hypothetical protein